MSFELMSAAVAVDLPCNQKMVLLMLANRTHSDMGYCYPSIKRLAQDCGLSETATKNAIKVLVSLGFVSITQQAKDGMKLPNRYTLSIKQAQNHDGRETPIDRRETPEGGSPDAGGGSPDALGVGRQTPIKHQVETVKEPVSETNTLFDRFWSAYPRKREKDIAAKVFAKLKVNEQLLQEMLSAILIQRNSPGWMKDGGQYIPYPAKWLRAGGWKDEDLNSEFARQRPLNKLEQLEQSNRAIGDEWLRSQGFSV